MVDVPFHFCSEGYEYVVHVKYEEIYKILVFLLAIYVAGLVTKTLGMPPLVGQIITGFLVRVYGTYINPPFHLTNWAIN